MAKPSSKALISDSTPGKVVVAAKSADAKPPTLTFKEVGGTDFIAFNTMLVHQASASYPATAAQREGAGRNDEAIAAMASLAPRDAQEGMLAAQMFGLHSAAMNCLMRSAVAGQTFEAREMNLNQAAKLSRTYALLMDTLARHRGGGTQKIIVERVTVNAGGQAIVGIEHAREGVHAKREEQPHAKQLAYAPLTALPGLDAAVESMPVTRNAQRSLPHARRRVAGGTEGQ